ncbi:hypothetical protein N9198_04905, partial [Akkermansiaceae bacterium]|nr:hypothetical protein [Akkermansiaceae bacterium]
PVVVNFFRPMRLFVKELIVPEAKLVEIKVVLYLGSETTIAGEPCHSGAEKGRARMFAGFGLAGADLRPDEGRG